MPYFSYVLYFPITRKVVEQRRSVRRGRAEVGLLGLGEINRPLWWLNGPEKFCEVLLK